MAMNSTSLEHAGDGRNCDVSLAVNPFEALKPHFGMLLGVQDFHTIDAYHRGKQWLHNGWLHGAGVVWGLEVTIDTERDEIRVAPGLAIDALGRELYLPGAVCLNLPGWFEKHRDDDDLQAEIITHDNADLELSLHVVIRFRACLARQVPALMEPCEGGSATTAYSRIMESVEVLLVPGAAPAIGGEDRPRAYHRLRLLFNLEDAVIEDGAVTDSDQAVIDERDRILGLPAEQQPREYLNAFRRFAALDEMMLEPDSGAGGDVLSLFPARDPTPVILADLNQVMLRDKDLVDAGVDNTVRDTHVATATIQELLCGPLMSAAAAAGGDPQPGNVADAGGVRIDPDSVATDGASLNFDHTGPDLLRRSLVGGGSVLVSSYDAGSGWSDENIVDIQYAASTVQLFLERPGALASEIIRLVVKGTGSSPVLGDNRVPLAGALGGPPGTAHDGHDFAFMLKTGG